MCARCEPPCVRGGNETRKLVAGAPFAFDSIDGQNVELLFVLLVPESTNQVHLNLLAQLADCFSNDQFRRDLQLATDSDELFKIARRAFQTAEA